MKEPVEIEMESDRKMPVIGTQILDNNIPSELNFKQEQQQHNPEETPSSAKDVIQLKHFNIRGKGIFDMQPKYKQGDAIPAQSKKYPVKAYNDSGRGLRTLWEAVMGYSKKQLVIEDGYLYITDNVKHSNIVQLSFKLNSLMKIFVDSEDKKIRLVFREQDKGNKRINKDYQLDQIQSLMEKMLLECNVIGLTVSEDQV